MEMTLKGHKIKFNEKVDEPSNIKWENLETSNEERFLRGFCTIILLLITMILTILIIIVANIIKPTNP